MNDKRGQERKGGKPWTSKILPWQVDPVVNKTRRRSSLLTTPATVDASWLDAHSLLHIGQP